MLYEINTKKAAEISKHLENILDMSFLIEHLSRHLTALSSRCFISSCLKKSWVQKELGKFKLCKVPRDSIGPVGPVFNRIPQGGVDM